MHEKVVQLGLDAIKIPPLTPDVAQAMSGTTRITGTPTSVAEVLTNRLWERPRRTLMDGELYEALSPQAKAQMATAAGAVPAAATEKQTIGERPEPRPDVQQPAVSAVGHVDVLV